MRLILRAISWGFLALCVFIVTVFVFGDDHLHEGNSELAALMVVLALTGMVWIPIAAVVALVGAVLEYRQHRSWSLLARDPSVYVLIIAMLLLGFIFLS